MIWSDNTKNAERNNPVSPGATSRRSRPRPSLAGVEGMYSFLTPMQVRHRTASPRRVLASQVTPAMFTLLGRAPDHRPQVRR